MAGFGFGSTSNPTSTAPSFLTGSNQNPAPTGFNLGGSTATSNLFGGTPAQSSGFTGFGAPASTGLSFGATPAQTNTGLSFGTSTLGQTSGISFGAPTSTATTGLFGSSFGSSAPQSTGLSFGAPAAQTTGLSFGQPAAQTAPAFGATPASQAQVSFGQPAASTGLSFGASAPQPSGISFGSFAATTASTGLSFGGPTASVAPTVKPTTASTGFSFGAPSQTSAPSTGFSLTGNPTTTSTGLSFGAPTSTTGLGFGSLAAATTASLGFQGLSTSTTTSKPLTLFGSTPSTTSTGLGLSLSTPSTQAPGLGSLGGGTGLFGASKPLTLGQTSTSTGISFGTIPTSTPATSASVGLGGIDTTVNKIGQTGSGIGRAEKAVKENQIPNEITQTIDGFKAFVKSQKSFSSDIARGSMKPLDKVREDTEAIRKVLSGISSDFQKNRLQSDRLKTETAAAIRNAEMAQRTHDTPPGLQLDNVAPLRYFNDLVAQFEIEMHTFRQEIENTEKHIGSLTEPRALTPQELSLAMRRLHDSFVALAGRLQTVHNSVELQKDQYMNLRKYFLKDTTSVFEETKKSAVLIGRRSVQNRISFGPTPFSSLGNDGYEIPTTFPSEPKSTFLTINSTGWSSGLPQTNLTNNSLSLSLPSSSTQDNQNFLLQKPPPGAKRGKH